MKEISSYIVGIAIAVLGLFPPLRLEVQPPSHFWPWMVIIAAFAGFYTLFIKTDTIVQILAVGAFAHAFFSANPFESFTQYINIIICCYFYILCRSIKDHTIVFKFLKCLLAIHVFMFGMQYFQTDRLLNFSQQVCFGVVGQHMQSASFSVVLAAVLMSESRAALLFPMATALFCNSAGAFLSVIAGLIPSVSGEVNKKFMLKIIGILFTAFIFWMVISGKLFENVNLQMGRLGAWWHAMAMWWQRPVLGWGFGTFKGLFPAMGGLSDGPQGALQWVTLHNCWLQILFEGGLVWFGIVVLYFSYLSGNMVRLMRRAFMRKQAAACLAGLLMIGTNMMIHFPTRIIQTVLIIIFFIAYCQEVISHGARQARNS